MKSRTIEINGKPFTYMDEVGDPYVFNPMGPKDMEEILEELRDIGQRDGISCTCGCREYRMKINYSSVELFCARCDGALKIPASTMSDIEDLCCKPVLLIHGRT